MAESIFESENYSPKRICVMAEKNEVKNIFLSASVPKPGREFYGTEDVIAIRDSVIALASVVLANPHYHLIWGGHPSITPLIALVLERYDLKMSDRVTLYQSDWFRDVFPPENQDIGIRIITEKLDDVNSSLTLMRKKMIDDNEYEAAVFIGGMKGIFDEYDLFTAKHPEAKVLPVASTGAAARALFEKFREQLDKRLLTELSYTSLFKEMLDL